MSAAAVCDGSLSCCKTQLCRPHFCWISANKLRTICIHCWFLHRAQQMQVWSSPSLTLQWTSWHSGHHDTFAEVWTVMNQAAWVDFSLVCQLMNEPGHCESLLLYHKGFLINKPDPVHSVCNVVRALHSTVNTWVYNWHFSSFDPQSLWPPCVADADIILSSCGFFYPLSSFFPRLISAVGDWMSTILPHMVWP